MIAVIICAVIFPAFIWFDFTDPMSFDDDEDWLE